MQTSVAFWRLAVAAVALAAPARAQVVTNPLGGLIDAYRLGSEIRTNRALEDLLRAQAEATRAQAEQLRLQSRNSDIAQQIDRDFDSAVAAVRARYPDFEQYRVEAARLMGKFDAPRNGQFNLEHYIEGMYLMAKYASFSTVAKPKESAAMLLVKDPEFHKLPMESRIRFVRDVEPGLTENRDADLEIVLTGIAKKVTDGQQQQR